jgi:hypothetical protein
MRDFSTGARQGHDACSLLIETLEAELARARQLRDAYCSGELESATLIPLRHFCAGLVDSAVELARSIGDLDGADRQPVQQLDGSAEGSH